MRNESLYLREGTAVLLVKVEPSGNITPIGNAYVCNNPQHLAAPTSGFNEADALAFVPIWEKDGSVPNPPSLEECLPVTVVSYDSTNDAAVLKIADANP